MQLPVHAVWIGGQLPLLGFVCIDDWRKQGFDFKLWTDSDPQIQEWIKNCRFAEECYKKKLYAFVTDYLRLKILQEFGGLYLDTDVTIQNDPGPLFKNIDFSVGYETDEYVGNAIIFAKKNSKIIARLIDFYENDIWSSSLYMGPQILTHILIEEQFKSVENCKIYPYGYFYNFSRENKSFETSEKTYFTHWFQHSWKKSDKLIFLKSKHLGLLGKIYVWQKYFFRI